MDLHATRKEIVLSDSGPSLRPLSLTTRPLVLFKKTVKRPARANHTAEAGVCQIASFDPKAVSRAKRALPSAEQTLAAADRLGSLGNPGRFSLLLALDGHELCVCDCAQVLGGSISAASQHLKALRQLGAITFRTAGKMAYYRIADPRWVALAHAALDLLEAVPSRRTRA